MFFLLVAGLFLDSYAVNATTNYKLNKEITVRTISNFKKHTDVTKFMKYAKKTNIKVINISVKQDEDDEIASGYTYYKSSIAPMAKCYKNYDVLKDVINEAHKNSIKVRA